MAGRRGGLLLLLAAALLAGSCHAAYLLPPLPFDPSATAPVINAQTNVFHHDVHHAGYIKKTNDAVGNYSQLSNLTLTELMGRVGPEDGLPRAIRTTVRNQGGGAWNHDFWWRELAPVNSTNTSTTTISSALRGAINSDFGSLEDMMKKFKQAAKDLFGSGWVWVVATEGGKGPLRIVSTPNQDNPLMNLPGHPFAIPILGIDLWEHSFYLQWGPKKADFVEAFPSVINWAVVSENFEHARLGHAGVVIGTAYDAPS